MKYGGLTDLQAAGILLPHRPAQTGICLFSLGECGFYVLAPGENDSHTPVSVHLGLAEESYLHVRNCKRLFQSVKLNHSSVTFDHYCL